jgi:hypothetical protein
MLDLQGWSFHRVPARTMAHLLVLSWIGLDLARPEARVIEPYLEEIMIDGQYRHTRVYLVLKEPHPSRSGDLELTLTESDLEWLGEMESPFRTKGESA